MNPESDNAAQFLIVLNVKPSRSAKNTILLWLQRDKKVIDPSIDIDCADAV